MVDIKNIQTIYFIGIGGIGMSALARYFSFHGKEVSGYDKTETALTRQLVSEGIDIHYEDNIELAPKSADIIVYTPAIKEHAELKYYQENNFTILKRSDVLGIITNGSFNICVAGTHGKTTISSMIAHILRHSGYGCNAFLGGIAVNYNSNYWSHERNTCVVEADEYDRSFLKLHPDIAVISSMDPDHLDIYGTEEVMQEAFIEFSGKVKKEGTLLSKFGVEGKQSFKAPQQLTYSLQNSSADAFATNIRMSRGSYEFDVMHKDWMLDNVKLNMGGMHNVENIVVAITIAHLLEIENEKIKDAVEAYKGVKRRFEYIIKKDGPESNNDFVYIDDYAHHPEELKALITGATSLFSGMHCTIIFQPHLFSRTKDFADAFAQTLDLADEVILLPIYPARELPMPGVTSSLVFDKMKNNNKRILAKHEVVEYIKGRFANDGGYGIGNILITAGAGDVDALVQPLKEMLTKKGEG